MLPLAEGETHSLSDCNVSYKRSALDATRALWRTEFHENVINEALRQSGQALWFDPAMVVYEQRNLSIVSAIRDRFSFGRLFGSTRVSGSTPLRRLAWTGAALLMPPVLVMRVIGNLRRRGRHLDQLTRCLPSLAVIATAWMAGEAVGYLTGTAGRELRPGGDATPDDGLTLASSP
jgi:hypothetical protein